MSSNVTRALLIVADVNLPFFSRKHNPWVNSFTMEQLQRFAPKTVYDIGCGDGYYGRLVKHLFPDTQVVGIDANSKWANHCKGLVEYDKVILADIVTIVRTIGGEGAIAGDILEHLVEKDMKFVLDNLVANFKWVIVNSPLNFQLQPHNEVWEVHRCGLNRETFRPYNVLEFHVKEEQTADSLPMINILLQGKKAISVVPFE